MNWNMVIALLEHKGVLEAKEAEELAKKLGATMSPANYTHAKVLLKSLLSKKD